MRGQLLGGCLSGSLTGLEIVSTVLDESFMNTYNFLQAEEFLKLIPVHDDIGKVSKFEGPTEILQCLLFLHPHR